MVEVMDNRADEGPDDDFIEEVVKALVEKVDRNIDVEGDDGCDSLCDEMSDEDINVEVGMKVEVEMDEMIDKRVAEECDGRVDGEGDGEGDGEFDGEGDGEGDEEGDGEVDERADEGIDEEADEEGDREVDGGADEATDEAVGDTIIEVTTEAIDELVDEAIDELVDEAINGGADEVIDEVVGEALDGIAGKKVDGEKDENIDGVPTAALAVSLDTWLREPGVSDGKSLADDNLRTVAEDGSAILEVLAHGDQASVVVGESLLLVIENTDVSVDSVDGLAGLSSSFVGDSEGAFDESGSEASFVDVNCNSEDDDVSGANVIFHGWRSDEVAIESLCPEENDMLGSGDVTEDSRASDDGEIGRPAEVRADAASFLIEEVAARKGDGLRIVPGRGSAVLTDATLGRRTKTVSSASVVAVVVKIGPI
jgi:hypothetical protein